MKRFCIIISVLLLSIGAAATTPQKIVVPDIEGYKTLKCDFHVHTIFSDATVWPTTRVEEAVWEGLDVIAITEHVETRLRKQVNKGYFNAEKCDRNASYEIAKKAAGDDLIVIRGAEITRGMPPGHFNCLFVQDANPIAVESEKFNDNNIAAARAGLKEAHRQGAITMWNHPNWERQAPEKTVMWPVHHEFHKEGYLQCIEVYNQFSGYSPEAHQWALDMDAAILGNSDCHDPMFMSIDYASGQHRPVSLVFAESRTEEGVREAIEAKRTAILAENMVYGRGSELKPLFEACVTVKDVHVSGSKLKFTLVNNSSIPIRLVRCGGSEGYTYIPDYELRPFSYLETSVYLNYDIEANKSVKFPEDLKSIDVNYEVANFFVGPGIPLKYTFTLELK